MSNIVPFQAASGAIVVPEHLAALFGAGNLSQGESIPHLSTKGKVWKIVKEGNETPLMTTDADGNSNPTPVVKVVILDATPGRSRTYYSGTYTEGSNAKPTCHSYDGIKPASDSDEPQFANCQACPHAIKGSKITDQGYATTACAPNKILALVPSNKLDFDVLRLRLAITSVYDKDNAEEVKGWYALDQYQKYLKSRGVTHTAMVETSMKFDSSTAYPKVLFRASGMLSEEAMTKTAKLAVSDEVKSILGLDKGHAGATESAMLSAPKATPIPKVEADDSGFGESETTPVVEPKIEKPKAVKPKVEPKPKAEAKPEVKVEPVKAVVVDEADDDLASALSNWDD